jgi:uncharacterized protein YndB with AHSA1/START domain
MHYTFVARAEILIHTEINKLWTAITNPYKVKLYFESDQAAEWKAGSPLTFKGQFQGREYQDKGIITEIIENKAFEYSFWSQFSGKEDRPENYSLIRYELDQTEDRVKLTVTQNNYTTQAGAEQSSQEWAGVLASVKQMMEK